MHLCLQMTTTDVLPGTEITSGLFHYSINPFAIYLYPCIQRFVFNLYEAKVHLRRREITDLGGIVRK